MSPWVANFYLFSHSRGTLSYPWIAETGKEDMPNLKTTVVMMGRAVMH